MRVCVCVRVAVLCMHSTCADESSLNVQMCRACNQYVHLCRTQPVCAGVLTVHCCTGAWHLAGNAELHFRGAGLDKKDWGPFAKSDPYLEMLITDRSGVL